MRTAFDFTPLLRSSIGFDRILEALEATRRVEPIDKWPPYDIVKSGEDDYRITMAAAGFTQDDLHVMQEHNVLVVSGEKAGGDDGQYEYQHRGITGRAFQRRFKLADHVKVIDASLVNGLLTVGLKRELPEEMKPRCIAVASGRALPKVEAEQVKAEKSAA